MNQPEQDGLEIVAKLMCVAARTAPKTGGVDHLQVAILTAEEKNALAAKMLEVAEEKFRALQEKSPAKAEGTKRDWGSDAQAVEKAGLAVLMGVKGRKVANFNCGGCGYTSCAEFSKKRPLSMERASFPGPFCIFRVMDLSIAVSSAVKVAMDLNADNRLMQKMGIAALQAGMLAGCDIILGIPLSATGKNIFFDHFEKLEAWKTIRGNNK